MPKLLGTLGVGGAGASSLLTGLVAYWALDEASGTRADATGRGNSFATVNNAPGNTTGKVGSAIQLTSASSQWLKAASTADLTIGDNDCTIALWVCLDSKSGQRTFLSKWSDNTTADQEYTVQYVDSTNRFRFWIGGFSKSVDATTLGSPSLSTWYFIVAQHDAANDLIKIGVNAGTLDTAATAGVAPTSHSMDLGLGSQKAQVSANQMDGRIDEVGIWKRLLTSGEITALYNAGAGRTYPFVGT